MHAIFKLCSIAAVLNLTIPPRNISRRSSHLEIPILDVASALNAIFSHSCFRLCVVTRIPLVVQRLRQAWTFSWMTRSPMGPVQFCAQMTCIPIFNGLSKLVCPAFQMQQLPRICLAFQPSKRENILDLSVDLTVIHLIHHSRSMAWTSTLHPITCTNFALYKLKSMPDD